MRHIFLLHVKDTPFFINGFGENTVSGYVPDKNGDMFEIEFETNSLPIDEDMVEEIKEILK